jgi:hypothetical protein
MALNTSLSLTTERRRQYALIYKIIIKTIPGFTQAFRMFEEHPEKLEALAKMVCDEFQRIYPLFC